MYKLLDYDITEYKQLENTLNELSKQGYNPTSLGKISRFEKNEKHYYLDRKSTRLNSSHKTESRMPSSA